MENVEIIKGLSLEDAKVAWKEAKGSMRGFKTVWDHLHGDEEKSEMADDDVAVAMAVPEAAEELGMGSEEDHDEVEEDAGIADYETDFDEEDKAEDEVNVPSVTFEEEWNNQVRVMVSHGHSVKSIIGRVLALAGNGCSYSDCVAAFGVEEFGRLSNSVNRSNPEAIFKLAKFAWECSPPSK